jgi:hypothetical protein
MRLVVVTSARQNWCIVERVLWGNIMVCGSSLRAAALMVLVVCAVVVAPITAKAQQSDDLDALNRQVEQLFQAGKYSEATDIAKRELAVAERQFGPDDAKIGAALNNLAALYRAQGRYAECHKLTSSLQSKRAISNSLDAPIRMGRWSQIVVSKLHQKVCAPPVGTPPDAARQRAV